MERVNTGIRDPNRYFYGGAVVLLGLLNIILLVRLVELTFCYQQNLQSYGETVSSLTEDKQNLMRNLSEMDEKLNNLHRLYSPNRTCPAEWSRFGCSCYILSERTNSWHKGREDCRTRGADLVVIETAEEMKYISMFTHKPVWIGLNSETGIWSWVDGSPLIVTKWFEGQPDNGGGKPYAEEENCAHVRPDGSWEDLTCGATLWWLCEKLL